MFIDVGSGTRRRSALSFKFASSVAKLAVRIVENSINSAKAVDFSVSIDALEAAESEFSFVTSSTALQGFDQALGSDMMAFLYLGAGALAKLVDSAALEGNQELLRTNAGVLLYPSSVLNSESESPQVTSIVWRSPIRTVSQDGNIEMSIYGNYPLQKNASFTPFSNDRTEVLVDKQQQARYLVIQRWRVSPFHPEAGPLSLIRALYLCPC